MKLVNKDMTRESVHVATTDTQIYIKIFHKYHGKWQIDTYFVSYGFVDEELIASTVKYIKRTWGLRNPIVRIE